MWHRFTERTRNMALRALEESRQRGEPAITTAHLLRGMLRDSECVGTQILARAGVSPEQMAAALERQAGTAEARGERGFTAAARQAIARAYEQVTQLNDSHIGTEHFLLGLIAERESLAGRALAALGLDSERALCELRRLQDGRAQPQASGSAEIPLPQYTPEADPYPAYHQMRAEDPVHWNPDWNAWILTRYAEVAAVLKDSRVSVTRGMGESLPPEPLRQEFCGLLDMLASQMVFSDPPNHTRLRALVSKAFSARTIEAMRPRIEQIVNAALDRVEPAGKMEVIQDLAYPLPITVIAEMLGVPAEDRPLLRKWSDAFFAFLEGATTLAQDQAVLRSMAEMTDYFRHLIASRAQTPQDDLLNALASAREQGDALSEAELYGNCLLLLAAGHETTVNLIGNGLLALLRHPAQHRLLRENPDLAASAVEEFLRYDCPVQWTERRATADLLVGGKQVAKGQSLHIGLGAANRDPAQFPDPDRLDITRRENRHVAFGHGIHFCAGAALARLEGQIAFRTLLRRFPSLRLDTDTVFWQKDSAFRRLQTLPVVWT